jgi:hypothetical protein
MAADEIRDRPGQHRPQHEELAMRDIHHPHDAEHQRQAERRQRQHGGGDEPFECGQQEMGTEGHSGVVLDGRPLAGGVDYGRYPDATVANFIDNAIARMRDEFTCVRDESDAANLRKIRQLQYRGFQQQIDPYRGPRIILSDIFSDFQPFGLGFGGPCDLQSSRSRA